MAKVPGIKEYMDTRCGGDERKMKALAMEIAKVAGCNFRAVLRAYGGKTDMRDKTAEQITKAIGGDIAAPEVVATRTRRRKRAVAAAVGAAGEQQQDDDAPTVRAYSVLYPPTISEEEARKRYASSLCETEPAFCAGCFNRLGTLGIENLPENRAVCRTKHGWMVDGGALVLISDYQRYTAEAEQQEQQQPATAEDVQQQEQQQERPARKRAGAGRKATQPKKSAPARKGAKKVVAKKAAAVKVPKKPGKQAPTSAKKAAKKASKK